MSTKEEHKKKQVKFITLGEMILQGYSVQKLVTAIRKSGIYTFDAVDLPCKASDEDLQIVSGLLVAQYEYDKRYDAYVERTGTPLSPAELCAVGPQNADDAQDWVNPYEQFWWPENLLPDFDQIGQSETAMNALVDAYHSANTMKIGGKEWFRQRGKAAADARHSRPGGSREKRNAIQAEWASGNYASRDRCAEENCAALGIAFSTARNALKNQPAPKRQKTDIC